MFVVDTNILVYAANLDAPEHSICKARLEQARSGTEPWFITWGIVYEFLRITTHPKVFPRPWSTPRSLSFITALTKSPSCSILAATDRHAAVLDETLKASPGVTGNRMFDLHTVVLMKEHGVKRILSRDSDFLGFPGIILDNPLQ